MLVMWKVKEMAQAGTSKNLEKVLEKYCVAVAHAARNKIGKNNDSGP